MLYRAITIEVSRLDKKAEIYFRWRRSTAMGIKKRPPVKLKVALTYHVLISLLLWNLKGDE